MDELSFPILLGALALGLCLIAIEIFVAPGFGVPGVLGLLLVGGAVVFAFLHHGPRGGLLALGLAVAIMSLGGWIAKITVGRRLLLKERLAPEPAADRALAHLTGAEGVALSDLRPSGVARFGERRVDVTADGDYLEAGTRVVVTDVSGNRVTVREPA